MKKAMELSKLCGVDVHLVVFDKQKKRLVQYNSTDEFSVQTVEKILTQKSTQGQFLKFEKYTNADYDTLQINGKQDPSQPMLDQL